MVELFVGVTPYGNGAIDYSATPRKLHLGESGANLTFEKKSNVFKDLKDVGTTRSFTFDVPRCQENEEAFLQWGEVQSDSFLWYSSRPLYSCWLYENGVEVFAGVLVIQEATQQVYKCNITEFNSSWQVFKANNPDMATLFNDNDFFYWYEAPAGLPNPNTAYASMEKWVDTAGDGSIHYYSVLVGIVTVKKILERLSSVYGILADVYNVSYAWGAFVLDLVLQAPANKLKTGVLGGEIYLTRSAETIEGFYKINKIPEYAPTDYHQIYDPTWSDQTIFTTVWGSFWDIGAYFMPAKTATFWGVSVAKFDGTVKIKTNCSDLYVMRRTNTAGNSHQITLDADGYGEYNFAYVSDYESMVYTFITHDSNPNAYVLIYQINVSSSSLGIRQKVFFGDTFDGLKIIDFLQEIATRYGLYATIEGDKLKLWSLNSAKDKVLNYNFADWTDRLQEVKTMKRYRDGYAEINWYLPAGDEKERYLNELPDNYKGRIGTNFWQNSKIEQNKYQSKFGVAENSDWNAFYEESENNLVQTDSTPLIWQKKGNTLYNSFAYGFTPATISDPTYGIPDEWYYFYRTHQTEEEVLANYVELKAVVYMTAEDYRTIDITQPIYLQQYNSFFIIESIRRTAGKHTAEVVLIKLNIYDQRHEPEPDEGEGGSSDLPQDEPLM